MAKVHMTLSDYRRAIDDGTGEPAYYSQVVSASEYYPPVGGHGPDFGMLLTDGNYSCGSYRFGFNGMEMDNEIKGTGNSINFKYRMHDPRIGRFLSLDPLTKSYPWYAPYQFAGNTPIMAIDIEGAEPKAVITDNYVTKPVIGFIKGAVGISQDVQAKTFWRMGKGVTAWDFKKPGAITWGRAVYYSPGWESANTQADIPAWVGLVGHEHTHRQQISNEYWIPFLYNYYGEYSDNQDAGMSDYQAYRNISYEIEGFGNETLINDFFRNSHNLKDFNNILLDKNMSMEEKTTRMEILGLEKIAIPELQKKISTMEQLNNKQSEGSFEKLITTAVLNGLNLNLKQSKIELQN